MDRRDIIVLVAEDQPYQAEAITDKLHAEGFDVMGPFSTGEEALKSAAVKRPSVALLDIGLKGTIDGVEVAESLYAEYGTGIVFLSHLSDHETRKRIKTVPAIFYSKGINLIDNFSLYDSIERMATDPPAPLVNAVNSHQLDVYFGKIILHKKRQKQVVSLDDVIYFEGASYLVKCKVISDEDFYDAKGTLKEVQKFLSANGPSFLRISKTHIVNLDHVIAPQRIGSKDLLPFKDPTLDPLVIGRAYKKDLRRKLPEI